MMLMLPAAATHPTASSSSHSSDERRNEKLIDFTFENPYDGRLKDTPFIRELVSQNPGLVFATPTSYCHYDAPYQKRTIFIGTLPGFNPKPPCPTHPCLMKRRGEKHSAHVAECSQAQKNSIPPTLVSSLVDAWLSRAQSVGATGFLLIDVFSGWGSVAEHIKVNYPHIKTFANDIVNRAHLSMTLDMTTFTLGSLLLLAVRRFWNGEDHLRRQDNNPHGIIGWLKDEKIAVLFHLSTPCETYSTNALAHHRVAGTAVPKTQQAVDADQMNRRLVDYLVEHTL